MTQPTKLLVGAVSLLVAGSLGYSAVLRARDEVTTIVPGPITRAIVARAAVVPVNGVSKIRTRIDGMVTRVHVREGDKVRAGQVLAELEAEELTSRVERARAEVAVHEAILEGVLRGGHPDTRRELSALKLVAERELTLARQHAERAALLRAQGSLAEVPAQEASAGADIAQARLQATEARLKSTGRGGPFEISAARHRLAAARAELSAMETESLRVQLTAPSDGVVLSRRVDPGDVVRALSGSILFELADPDHVELRGEVEELQAPLLRAGARVQITAPGGLLPLGSGRVVRIAPGVGNRLIAGDPSELRADSLVRAVYITPDPGTLRDLPIGQRVEARIALQTESVAARLPREAVKLENGSASVLVQNGLMRQQRNVRLGLADERNIQVDGLPLGTRVVISARD
jgi:multidrug efflux pump subunit AcrA (membrane-fusion protein)